MITAAITCAQSAPSMGRRCHHIEFDVPAPAAVAAQITEYLTEYGWVEHEGAHYCPVHNPTEIGQRMMIGASGYRPIGDSGWEARIPDGGFGTGATFEIDARRIPGLVHGGGDD